MLYLISLGLSDEKDMSLRALETAKSCDKLYVEFYTTSMNTDVNRLEKLVGKPVIELKRPDLEENAETILKEAKSKDVGILIGGDALVATTHISLLLEAKKNGVKAQVIHGSSIYSAVGETGLQIYKFGKTTTLALPEEIYSPMSAYETILQNKKAGLHTLVLLDIKEGKLITVKEGIELLMKMEKEGGLLDYETKIVAACELGGRNVIKYGKIKDLLKSKELGLTPAVLIVPGELHFMEQEFLETISL